MKMLDKIGVGIILLFLIPLFLLLAGCSLGIESLDPHGR